MASLIQSRIFNEFLQSKPKMETGPYTRAAAFLNIDNNLLEKIAGVRMDESKHGNKFEVFSPFRERDSSVPSRTLGNYVVTQNYLPLVASMVLDVNRFKSGYNPENYGNLAMLYYDMKSGTPKEIPNFSYEQGAVEPFDFDVNKIVQSKGGVIDVAIDAVKSLTASVTGSKYINPDKLDMTHLIAKSFGGQWVNNKFNLVAHPSISNQTGGVMQAEKAAKAFYAKPENEDKHLVYTSIPYWTNEQKSIAKKHPEYFLAYAKDKMARPDSLLTVIQVVDENGKLFQPVGWISRDDGSWRVKVGKELDYEFKKIGYEVRK